MAGGGDRPEEPITEINVTPLVDVCLVLVIIFMAIAPFAMTAGISVMESRAKAAEGKASADENVNVKLNAAGVIAINSVPVGPEGLLAAISKALIKSKDKMVIITADDANKVGEVVAILDTARQAGAVKLTIMKSEDAPAAAKGRKS